MVSFINWQLRAFSSSPFTQALIESCVRPVLPTISSLTSRCTSDAWKDDGGCYIARSWADDVNGAMSRLWSKTNDHKRG